LDAVDGDAFNERRAGDVNLGLEGAGINESDRAEGRYQLELNGDGKSERLGKEGREGGRVREGSKRDDDAVVKVLDGDRVLGLDESSDGECHPMNPENRYGISYSSPHDCF
jgi:hypothetical protein